MSLARFRRPETELDELLPLDRVAARYQVTAGTVRRWIRQGRLAALRIAGRTWITKRDLAAFEAQAREHHA